MQIFFCVVLYGLLHGLLFLPVLLSWVGPSPYDSAYDGDVHPDEKVPPDAAVQVRVLIGLSWLHPVVEGATEGRNRRLFS